MSKFWRNCMFFFLSIVALGLFYSTSVLTPKDSQALSMNTNPVASGALGAVQFSDGNSGFSSENTLLHWDNVNDNLEIGSLVSTTQAGTVLHIGTGELQLDPTYTLMFGPKVAIQDDSAINNDLEIGFGYDDVEIKSASSFLVDTDTLFVDVVNNRVGIGTISPNTNLDIASETNSILFINGDKSNSSGEPGSAQLKMTTDAGTFGFTLKSPNLAALSQLDFLIIGGVNSGVEALSILSSLRVGINQSVPLTELHLTGVTKPSIYVESTTASDGGSLILEDTDGAGCTELTVLNGVGTFATITCP